MRADEPLANTVIGGRFILRELIGSGGMGKVFRAEQKGVGRTVAVKIMHRHLLGDTTAAARFTNEAQAASSLNHPNSIGILDFGQTEAGVLYIVMEYLRGRSLDAELRQSFPFQLGRVAHILCQALDAVHEAHEGHILHRDLKPENVFLLENRSNVDFVKVLDFGIAKLLDVQDRSVTTPGLVPGTPEYMSPEQARGEKLDARTDIYSLGVILYEMLTATVPFKGSSAIATMMSHVQDPVEPPSARRPDLEIPPAVDAVVTWALAKDPGQRISTARQFRDVLSAWAQVAGVWPTELDPTASSPDVLRDFFSAAELDQMTEEVGTEHRAGTGIDPPAAAAPVARRTSVLVGRQTEVERVRSFLDGEGARVLRLPGDTGMGRSRLAAELAALARERDQTVIRCQPDRGWIAPPLGAVRGLLLDVLGIDDADASASAVRSAAAGLELDANDVRGIEDLLNHPTGLANIEHASRFREWATAFHSLLTALGKRGPTVCIFENWEQLDDCSRDLVRRVVTRPPESVSLVVTYLADGKDPWSDEQETSATLEVSPLDSHAAALMASEMFSGAIDQSIAEDLGRASAGQPLFIAQLAFSLAYEGLTNPPDRLADLVAWRVERLRKEDRYILQWMSVLNEPVEPEAFGSLSGIPAPPSQFEGLVERGFLDSREGDFDYAHPFLAMVVYSSIPLEARREMHQAVAEYLRRRGSAIAVVANHAYQADDGRRAIEELKRAGVWSHRRLDAQGSILCHTRALELVRREWGRGRVAAEDLDEMAVDLALRLATVLRDTSQTPMAEGVLEEVLSVAAGNDMARARLRLNLGQIDMDRGNVQRAVRHLQLAQNDATGSGSSWLLADITRELARARALMGEREVAGQLLVEALRIAGDGEESSGAELWSALLGAATTCLEIGFPERAREYLAEALEKASAAQSSRGQMKILMRLGEVHLSRAEWDEADASIGQALELVDEIGDRTCRAELLIQMGRVRRIKGNVSEGRRYLRSALDLSQAIGWSEGVRLAQEESDILGLLSGKE